jgi:hypothetical protein
VHERLDVVALGLVVDDSREPEERAGCAQLVDPPLDGRRGEADVLADVLVRPPRVPRQ